MGAFVGREGELAQRPWTVRSEAVGQSAHLRVEGHRLEPVASDGTTRHIGAPAVQARRLAQGKLDVLRLDHDRVDLALFLQGDLSELLLGQSYDFKGT